MLNVASFCKKKKKDGQFDMIPSCSFVPIVSKIIATVTQKLITTHFVASYS